MARSTKNRRNSVSGKSVAVSDKEKNADPPARVSREVIDALAVAFILAFFIRTFVVEPFVIPTGSMSPALQGAHKDLNCPECGQRFRVNVSIVESEFGPAPKDQMCLAGMCPVCRYTVPFVPVNYKAFPDAPKHAMRVPDYSGDRIVVNKFLYSFSDPQRWDVVVFKYPGNATDNYIKRLVGLPNETLRIYHGDLYTGGVDARDDSDFTVERKPARVVRAMRQLVHDTNHDAKSLYDAGWPLRWNAAEENSDWTRAVADSGLNVAQRYTSTGVSGSWLRYSHYVPTDYVWNHLEHVPKRPLPKARPKLVDDYNPYNSRVSNVDNDGTDVDPFVVSDENQGVHWVGDLMVEVDAKVESAEGELVLEVVEGGNRFQAICDLAAGSVKLVAIPWQSDTAIAIGGTAKLVLAPGSEHRLTFANVDDQLHLWYDDTPVVFSEATTFDWKKLFGDRQDNVPRTSDTNSGDLAPVGIASRGAKVELSHLSVWRDIYYIASDSQETRTVPGNRFPHQAVTDFTSFPDTQAMFDPDRWDIFRRRQDKIFPLGENQLFVMGDNSPQSSDARLWFSEELKRRGSPHPGGHYLEQQLVIGRAISVVWPHMWNYVIPGISDMRSIR